MLNVKSAREIVLQHCRKVDRDSLAKDALPIWESYQKVVAEPAILDRDQPPFDRSMRDGFAVRAEDLLQVPVSLKCVGEIKAGDF